MSKVATVLNPKPKVLWVEDDLRYVRLLQRELAERFDFEVYDSLDGAATRVLKGETGHSIDAVMIDMHLAGGRRAPEEFEVLRGLGFDGPVFVLSNDETVVSKLEMLSLGVDDYLWKVMPTPELELRLNNVIQRYRTKFRADQEQRTVPASGVLSLDGLELHLDRLTASLHGLPLDLSKIEYRIILTLFRNHPQTTALSELKAEVWGQTLVESGTISTFLWKLNKKAAGWRHRVVRSGEEVFLRESGA